MSQLGPWHCCAFAAPGPGQLSSFTSSLPSHTLRVYPRYRTRNVRPCELEALPHPIHTQSFPGLTSIPAPLVWDRTLLRPVRQPMSCMLGTQDLPCLSPYCHRHLHRHVGFISSSAGMPARAESRPTASESWNRWTSHFLPGSGCSDTRRRRGVHAQYRVSPMGRFGSSFFVTLWAGTARLPAAQPPLQNMTGGRPPSYPSMTMSWQDTVPRTCP